MVLCNGLRMSFVSAQAGFLEKECIVNTDRSVFKTNGALSLLSFLQAFHWLLFNVSTILC